MYYIQYTYIPFKPCERQKGVSPDSGSTAVCRQIRTAQIQWITRLMIESLHKLLGVFGDFFQMFFAPRHLMGIWYICICLLYYIYTYVFTPPKTYHDWLENLPRMKMYFPCIS